MATTSAACEWRDGQGQTARALMAGVLRWITVAFLALFAITTRAASDWIDELPSVTTVAHAVSEQLKVDTANWRFDIRGIALKEDDDLYAVYLVGTFVVLRKIIVFKLAEEEKAKHHEEEKPKSEEEEYAALARETKLQFMVASYLEAELLIGQKVGKRRGYLTTAQKCRDDDCYRRWFKTGYSNVYISASYRARILSRLFPCGDRAAELDRLAQSYAQQTPYLPSPAETSTIEPELQGVAPAGCCVYGGDANRTGLCDDWQNPPLQTASVCPASIGCSRPKQPLFLGGELACEHCNTQRVEVRRGVSARQPVAQKKPTNNIQPKNITLKNCKGKDQEFALNPTGRIDDGITIRVKCAQGHVVQFISREYWLDEKTLESGLYGLGQDPADGTKLACFDKTPDAEDPEKRMWRTDSNKRPDPYYESSAAYITSCDSMTTIDAPSFALEPQHKKGRAVAKSFAVCGGNVVSIVDWSRELDAGASCYSYHVDPPREPTSDEIEKFQKQSKSKHFAAWP